MSLQDMSGDDRMRLLTTPYTAGQLAAERRFRAGDTDEQLSERMRLRGVLPTGFVLLGGTGKKAPSSPHKPKKLPSKREKKDRCRVPLSSKSKTILADYSSSARELIVGLALDHFLRQFNPTLLLQAATEMRAARIPLNVLLSKFLRDPKAICEVELRARIEDVLVVVERLTEGIR